MRVLLCPDEGGRSASSHYRMIWPGEEAQVHGADVTISDPEFPQFKGWSGLQGEEMRPTMSQLDDVPFDLVVLQRPIACQQLDLVDLLHEQGVKVAIELDDNFDCIPEGNVARLNVEPTGPVFGQQWRNRTWLHHIIDAADLLIAATPAIAHHYGDVTPTVVIPNFVPGWYLEIETEHDWDLLRIGLAQKIDTHPADFDVVRQQIIEVFENTVDVELYLLGAGREGEETEVRERLGLPPSIPIVYEPYCRFDIYPDKLARCDVGIVPLQLNDFNEAKSALKGLEYAALGVPFVASPTGPYRALQLECGIGVTTIDVWRPWLEQLLSSERTRQAIAEVNRTQMRGLTIEANWERWLNAWRTVCSSS